MQDGLLFWAFIFQHECFEQFLKRLLIGAYKHLRWQVLCEHVTVSNIWIYVTISRVGNSPKENKQPFFLLRPNLEIWFVASSDCSPQSHIRAWCSFEGGLLRTTPKESPSPTSPGFSSSLFSYDKLRNLWNYGIARSKSNYSFWHKMSNCSQERLHQFMFPVSATSF